MKLFLQEVSQWTLKCSTELKFSGFMDPQMHPHSHLHVITFLMKSFLKDVSQRTLSALKCSTSVWTQVFRLCGSSDASSLDVGCGCWVWMRDVDVLKFSGFTDPQMHPPLPRVGTLCIETLQNHYHKKPLSWGRPNRIYQIEENTGEPVKNYLADFFR